MVKGGQDAILPYMLNVVQYAHVHRFGSVWCGALYRQRRSRGCQGWPLFDGHPQRAGSPRRWNPQFSRWEGGVEGLLDDVLERTARREVLEETGITIADEMAYVESKSFGVDEPVVDIVLLCRYQTGEIQPGDPDEVAGVEWLTADEVLAHPKTPPWTAQSIRRAEPIRRARGW